MSDRRSSDDRRGSTDRRSPSRRRRGDARDVVIELTSRELRIAELIRSPNEQEPDRVRSARRPWRQEATKLSCDAGLAELTAALRELAREFALGAARVRFVLGGEYCIVRALHGSREEVRGELSKIEHRSQLYLALGPGEKAVVSHVTELDARHVHALAAVCNQATLSTLQQAADAVGIEIAFVEPALCAVVRTAARLGETQDEPFVLLHLDGESLDLGIACGSRLLMDFRPGGRTGVADLPKLLDAHLKRIARHVDRMLRTEDKPMRRLLVCGDVRQAEVVADQIAKKTPLEVAILRAEEIRATWQLSESADLSTPLVGGLLATYVVGAESDSPNLMQHLLDRIREPLKPILLRSLAPLAATLMVATGMLALNSREQAALDSMQAEIDGLAAADARARELRLQLLSGDAKLKQLERLDARLPKSLWAQAVRRIGSCLPDQVWLSKLELRDQKAVSLTGASYMESSIYEFLQYLEETPQIAEVALQRTNAGASALGPITEFELELQLTDQQLEIPQVARHE